MNAAEHDHGFLLDAHTISMAELHPAPGEYLMLPDLPVERAPADPNKVRSAVIDSGVLSDHPQLRGMILAQKDFSGSASPEDELGHGTVVALIFLRALFQGTNPQGRDPRLISTGGILSAKVVGKSGRIEREHVIAAIHWAAENGARVVNLSLGFRGTAEENDGLREAIAAHPKIMFAIAAGNFGPETTVYPAGFTLPNVLSVGATDTSGGIAAYSGKGQIYAPGNVTLQRGKEPPAPSRSTPG